MTPDDLPYDEWLSTAKHESGYAQDKALQILKTFLPTSAGDIVDCLPYCTWTPASSVPQCMAQIAKEGKERYPAFEHAIPRLLDLGGCHNDSHTAHWCLEAAMNIGVPFSMRRELINSYCRSQFQSAPHQREHYYVKIFAAYGAEKVAFCASEWKTLFLGRQSANEEDIIRLTRLVREALQ